MEKAIFKYRTALKQYFLTKETSKDFDRLHYKISGMEAILEALDIDTNKIIDEVLASTSTNL